MLRTPDAVAGNVLIVIPCLNEERHLPALLQQLLADAPEALIVVADGGSKDRSRAIVSDLAVTHPNVVLLDNPRRIQSAGVNLAVARHGEGRRWLIRIDAHCLYPVGYVSGLLSAAARTGATSVVVPMITRGESCFQIACAAAQNNALGTGGSSHRHVGVGQFVDHGHHALMAIDLFVAAGGYCENMSHNEDAELDLRLAGQGARIWLEPSQAITYFPRSDPRGLARQYLGYGRGRARTVMRHAVRLKLRQMLPLAVPPAALMLLLTPIWPGFALPFLVWALLCLIGGLVIGLRQRSACAALSGVAAMIMHLSWGTGFLVQRFFSAPAPSRLMIDAV